MKYCPDCEAEYLDHATRCVDCGVDLVDEAALEEQRRVAKEEWVKVTPVADKVEADQLVEILKRDRVPTHVRVFEETVYIGYSDMHQGYGELWVPTSWLGHARAVVDEFWSNSSPG